MYNVCVKRVILPSLLLLLSGSGALAGIASYEQELFVKLQPAENMLHATSVLTFGQRGDAATNIELARDAQIHRLKVNGKETDFTFSDGVIRFVGEEERSAGSKIQIEYSATFSD
ncbi:MAG: hypothetical protein GWO11_07950, partial [Desulfuromonadales bacterium]|nr:hypothetical protein [Desulfuromonadales bacterium]NIR34245.1 hypothetical protein [Desulfuromonadales bacterium]NIS44232.1 hypothetical protein [Desulfuromonadales bacterium]